MRLAFIFCFICSTGFTQSFGVKELYQIFNSTLPEADSFLVSKGFKSFELDETGKPRDAKAGLLYSRSSWVNENGEQEIWEYQLPTPLTVVGFYRNSQEKVIGDAAFYQPKLDTASIFKEVRVMRLERVGDNPGEWVYTDSGGSFVFMVTYSATGNLSLMFFLRKGDEMADRILNEQLKKNAKKSKGQ
jgi:hypothetical protein